MRPGQTEGNAATRSYITARRAFGPRHRDLEFERLTATIERLYGGGLEDNGGFIEPAREHSTALLAIMYDTEVRFGYRGDTLPHYAFALVDGVEESVSARA